MIKRIGLITSITILALIIVITGITLVVYTKVLPAAVSNPKVISCIEENANKMLGIDLEIINPELQTNLSTILSFKADEILIRKDNDEILTVENLDTAISFKEIFRQKITLKKFLVKYIYADVNKLMALVPEQQEKQQTKESNWYIDLFDTVLGLKKSVILYEAEPDIKIKLEANNMLIDNTQKAERLLHFNIDAEIKKAEKGLHFAIADKNKVFIQDKQLFVKNCILDINKSNVEINATASKAEGYNINLSSRNFKVDDVIDIIASNLIVNNGSEMLSFFKDIKGNFDFDITLTKNGMDGSVDVHNSTLKIVPLSDIPINLDGGTVQITSNDITLNDFTGYYGTQKSNTIALDGTINDYTNSCEAKAAVKTVATSEFADNYLSKTVGFPLQIVGKAETVIAVNSLGDKIDIICASKLTKGDDILVDGASLSPTDYDRAVKADLHFENNILDIKDINYYIASEIQRGVKVRPVLTLNGSIDLSKPEPVVNSLGFNIPNPLPSEFLNVLAGQKLFKGGKFYGDLVMLNNGEYPVIKGKLNADEIHIPSQKIFLKSGEFSTDRDNLFIKADGKYKRSEFTLKGNIANGIKYPIIVKDVDFSLDKIDVEKLMNSANEQNTDTVQQTTAVTSAADDSNEDDTAAFDINNLIIEKCIFRLKEGKYKDIAFGNLAANLTLNTDNIMKLQSNKFDIAEGTSTIKLVCDLKKHEYNLTLGIKDVNSDTMSTALLNLSREIEGKASGLIELNTDDSLKLNGYIKFAINDGTIQKIGLIEYILKFAAIFRNPVVMISPATLSDMVNIPDGTFEKISGDIYLKNNIIELLKIKSSSPQLSSYIVGQYNLETSDAILRIYTKFSNKNKGAIGFLRNFSLNSLANRIPLSSRNDAQYYSAELEQLPDIDADEKDCQIFLTKVDGDIEHNNFLSSLKKIK